MWYIDMTNTGIYLRELHDKIHVKRNLDESNQYYKIVNMEFIEVEVFHTKHEAGKRALEVISDLEDKYKLAFALIQRDKSDIIKDMTNDSETN